MQVCMQVYMHIMYAHNTCIYVCMFIYMYGCMYVCVHAWMYGYIYLGYTHCMWMSFVAISQSAVTVNSQHQAYPRLNSGNIK